VADDLFQAAKAVREKAYAPYSGFKVGAALRTIDGRVFTGANVENAAYPQGQCAEASAIGAMIAAGAIRVAEVCVVAGGEALVSPCGGCRQRLAEFADADAAVHLAGLTGIRSTTTVGALLPLGFGRVNLASPVTTTVPAVDRLRRLAASDARIAVVLGSGLAGFTEALGEVERVAYAELEGFPVPSVEGHVGEVVAGRLAGVPLMCLRGRVHLYEGGPVHAVNGPIRALGELGVRLLVLTNAAGALTNRLEPGSVALIADHINMLGANPLTGPNDDDVGPRFPDMSAVYDPELRARARAAAARLGIGLEEGVYLATPGPSFETPAEIRAFRALGAELVGMSTVPEAISARHAGLRVLGFSAVTNQAAGLGGGTLSHAETLAQGAVAGRVLARLLEALLPELAHDL
jgi:xanthosine phosphorylase